jgi:release factor glutamine methyltransferase
MKDLLQRKYANYVLKPFLQWYLKKDRHVNVNGFSLRISTGVFHPVYFFSSTYFADFISTLDLKGKTVLDIGSGSGILALTAYKGGATVTATDINPVAVSDTKINFETNFRGEERFAVLQSDLFSNVKKQIFDIILINPPYFFKAAQSDIDMAWNCGERGEYFHELFGNLSVYVSEQTRTYLILAENCEIDRIKRIAGDSNVALELVSQRKIKWEHNYIYQLKSTKV